MNMIVLRKIAFLMLLVFSLSACRVSHSNGLQKGRKIPKSGPIPCPVKDC